MDRHFYQGEHVTIAAPRTYAVKGTARTAEGVAPKIYTSKNGTKEEAQGMLADLQGVQERAGLAVNAKVIEIDADGNEVVPAERTTSGVGWQFINRFDADGEFIGRHRYYGTIAQARAAAALKGMHDTDLGFAAALAVLHDVETLKVALDVEARCSTAHFPTILAETRPSGFFATLAALPNAAA